jgi:hypothetical protein
MMARRGPWVIAVAAIVVFVLTSVLDPNLDAAANALFFGIATSLVLVGALLRTRVPGNRVGALLLIAGVMLTSGVVLGTYSIAGAQADPAWPATALARVMANAFYIYPIIIVLIGVPLVFPDGHLPSRRFRWVVWLTIAAMTAETIVGLFSPGDVAATGIVNPLAMPALVPVFDALNSFANLSAVFGFGGAAAALVVRFRRGGPIVREQLKWLIAVAAVATVAFPTAFLLQPSDPSQPSPAADGMFLLGFAALLALPAAIGVAILRYRLYDIDRIISRTISYALVSGALAVVFVSAVIALEQLFTGFTQGQTLAVAGSTLLAFALFQPLRRRIQHGVDRRFDRARVDSERTATAFAGRLRDQVDIDTVVADLHGTVRGALRPNLVNLWLREHR